MIYQERSMHSDLRNFTVGFWLCSIAFIVYALIAFIVTRRRHLWLRLLDAGEAFTMRLGFSKRVASFGRGFSESRGCAVSMVVFACIFLLMTIFFAVAYLYFRHRVT
jgi:hypothetical protein